MNWKTNINIEPLWWVKILIEGLVLAVVASILSFALISLYEGYNFKRIEEARSSYHGLWAFKFNVENTEYSAYKDLQNFYVASLSVDRNLKVAGTAYKWKEVGSKGEIYYKRADRSQADITGSIIGNEALLRWDNVTPQGLKSIVVLQAELTDENNSAVLRGGFFTDVAISSGSFCAEELSIHEISDEEYLAISCK